MIKIIIEIFSGFVVGSFFVIMCAIMFLLGIKIGKMISDEFDRRDK